MKVIKQEVKTFYKIALTIKDIVELFEEYPTKESNEIIYPNAFEKIDTKDTTMGNLRIVLKNFSQLSNRHTLNYVANHFGFDGWDNAGHFHEASQTYRMIVYTEGDTMD